MSPCRSYLHTLVMLLQLEQQLAGTVHDLPRRVLAAADAIEICWPRRDQWLPEVLDVLDGPHGTWLMAPAERYGNALQGALMMREARAGRPMAARPATGTTSTSTSPSRSTTGRCCSPVPGSTRAAANWMHDRGSRFVAVGAPVEGMHDADYVVRYPTTTTRWSRCSPRCSCRTLERGVVGTAVASARVTDPDLRLRPLPPLRRAHRLAARHAPRPTPA